VHGVRQWVVAVHESFRRDTPAPPRRCLDAVHILHAERQRLLAQHVLSRLERAHRPLGVQTVGQADIDDVDGGVVEQRLVRAEGARNLPLLGVGARLGRIAARHGDQIAVRRGADRRDDQPVDPCGAQQPPAHR
jgi:hypothetical protein